MRRCPPIGMLAANYQVALGKGSLLEAYITGEEPARHRGIKCRRSRDRGLTSLFRPEWVMGAVVRGVRDESGVAPGPERLRQRSEPSGPSQCYVEGDAEDRDGFRAGRSTHPTRDLRVRTAR
jgi:hypothetical protein